MERIIALDPGIGRTGYAVLEKNGQQVKPLTYGCISTKVNGQLEERLLQIYRELTVIVEEFKPTAFAMERLFFANNQKTAITVGQAQGVMLLVAANAGLTVEFITPLQIKSSLTGFGQAKKEQVLKMVMLFLNLKEAPKPDDTADALACGLTYLSLQKLNLNR